MTRNIDDLGRIVIPKEIREELNIHSGDTLKIETQGKAIILTKKHTLLELIRQKELIEKEIERLKEEQV